MNNIFNLPLVTELGDGVHEGMMNGNVFLQENGKYYSSVEIPVLPMPRHVKLTISGEDINIEVIK